MEWRSREPVFALMLRDMPYFLVLKALPPLSHREKKVSPPLVLGGILHNADQSFPRRAARSTVLEEITCVEVVRGAVGN